MKGLSLSVSIIGLALAVSSVVLLVVLPNIMHTELKSTAERKSLLTMDNSVDWSAIPGNSQFNIQKQTTLYELEIPNKPLTTINVVPKYTLNYNIS